MDCAGSRKREGIEFIREEVFLCVLFAFVYTCTICEQKGVCVCFGAGLSLNKDSCSVRVWCAKHRV